MYLYFVVRIGLMMVQWIETCGKIYDIDNTCCVILVTNQLNAQIVL